MAVLTCALLLATGCRLDLAVAVVVADDGSGTVTASFGLDGDAVERIGGDLAAVLELDDLQASGWEVADPDQDDDGITTVRLTHRFADPAEASEVLDQLGGADGPLQGLAVRQETSFARTDWGFTGAIDLRQGPEVFSDADLAEQLDGQPLGLSPEEIEAELGEPLSEVVTISVTVSLPGDVSTNAAASTATGGTWTARFGDDIVTMDATGEERRTSTIVAAAIGVGCLVLLVVYGAIALVRRRRSRRTGDGLSDDVV